MSHLQTLPGTEQETVGKGTRQRLAHSEGRQLVRGDKGHRGSGAGRKEMEPPLQDPPGSLPVHHYWIMGAEPVCQPGAGE